MQHREQSPRMRDQELVLWSLQMRGQDQELAYQMDNKLKLQVQCLLNQEGNY